MWTAKRPERTAARWRRRENRSPSPWQVMKLRRPAWILFAHMALCDDRFSGIRLRLSSRSPDGGPAAKECSSARGRIEHAHAQRLDETPAFEGDAFARCDDARDRPARRTRDRETAAHDHRDVRRLRPRIL